MEISINNAANGVFLPTTHIPDISAMYHQSLHTHTYYDIPFGDRKKENGAPVVLSFLKYSFYSQKIGDTPIFKDVSKPRFSIFVNDEFVDLVERSKLKGLKFNLAWEG